MTGKTGHRILIVDDDPGIRRTLQVLLRRAGYEVMQAGDGSEAVRLWRSYGGDIIAMSGGGQTKRLNLLGSASMLGAVLTIEKPFTISEMTNLVGRALRSA